VTERRIGVSNNEGLQVKTGPKPRRIADKRLEGRRIPAGVKDITFPSDDAARCPVYLDEIARGEWNRLAPELRARGLLTDVDVSQFAVYCDAYSRWRTATAVLREQGLTMDVGQNGYTQRRPEMMIAENAVKTMSSMAGKFGMTPGDRGGFVIVEPDGDSEMAALLDDLSS